MFKRKRRVAGEKEENTTLATAMATEVGRAIHCVGGDKRAASAAHAKRAGCGRASIEVGYVWS